MRSYPDTALVVRIHPEEDSWGSRELIGEAVGAAFGDLPENVRVILPGQSINSYALMDSSDVVLTYTSTTGIEAVVRGIPVAVCGQAHYRGKGFTIDVAGLDHLHEVLGGDAAVDERQIELAWRYAFTFFFRMCIPFPAVRETDPGVVDALASVPTARAEVTPGADPYLDFVCERMLSGGQFLLPEELVAPAAS
jgi:capsule polysaccharide export protein KpsC/LpsZ